MSDSVPILNVDSEVDHGTTTQWRPRRWMVVGMVTAVVGVAGVVYSGTRARVNPVHMQVARGHSIMRAYVGRVLADEDNYESKGHFSWRAAGADGPETMTIEGSLAKNHDTSPDAKFTFKAKEGKADDLKTQLEGILNEKKKLVIEMFGEEAGDTFSELVKVEDPDDDEVTVKVIDPAPEDFSDVDDDLKSSPPKFDGRLSFGRGLKEMVTEGKEDSVLTVTKGFEMDSHVSMATEALKDLVSDLGLGPEVEAQLEMFKEMASETSEIRLRYKPDAKFESMPKMGEAMMMLSQMASELPDALVQKLKGLDEVADGLTDITIGGLPGKYEIDMDLTNFHVAPVIKEILDNMPEREDPFSTWA